MSSQKRSDKNSRRSERPVSRESSRASSRGSTVGKQKDAAVLSAGSLAILARAIGADNGMGLVFCMYLNIPTTTIVKATNEASDTGLLNASDTLIIEATQRCLLIWKDYRAGSKDKDTVRDMERALKEMGKPEFADVINDKFANNVELASEFFANL